MLLQNLPHLLILQEVTKVMFRRVIYELSMQGEQRGKKIRNITKEVSRIFPDEHKATLVYTDTKLGSNFNIKDNTKRICENS